MRDNTEWLWPFQEYIITKNIYTPNMGAPKYIKWILRDIKGETDSNTIIAVGFNTLFTSMERSYRQKIHKEAPTSSNTLCWMDLINIYRTVHHKAVEHIIFKCSSMHREDVVCMYNGLLLSHKKNEILSVSTTWIDLEGAILSEIIQSETDKYHMISLNVDSKKQNKWTNITKHNQNHRYIQRTNRWLPKGMREIGEGDY